MCSEVARDGDVDWSEVVRAETIYTSSHVRKEKNTKRQNDLEENSRYQKNIRINRKQDQRTEPKS